MRTYVTYRHHRNETVQVTENADGTFNVSWFMDEDETQQVCGMSATGFSKFETALLADGFEGGE